MGFIEGVAISVVAMLIGYYVFGIGGSSKVTVIQGKRSARGWRRTNMIGRGIAIAALFMGVYHILKDGASNLYVGLAVALFIVGFITASIGAMGYRWFKD